MKLRTRKKRFSSNIKQEDCKPTSTLINAQLSTTEIAKSSTIGPIIKQEDSKDHKVLLKQHVKNLDKEPDLYDPDFYCKSCEKGYSNTFAYRQHLRAAHFMVLKRLLPKRAAQKIDIAPDPNDPNFHCRACNFTYKHKKPTRPIPTEFANPTSSSGSLTDTYCQACDKRLSGIYHYRRHLFIVHKVDIKQFQRKRNDILPIVSDCNFDCHSCEKKMASKKTLKQHLQLVHSIFKSAPPQSKLKPDVDDPNNYCRACQKSFPTKKVYRAHLRKVHQMQLLSLRSKVNHKQLPDPYNRDYYCSVCKKNYAQMNTYRQHCRQAHFMTLDHHSIVNPKAKINVNDPDFYCSQCERSFTTNLHFKRHLGRVHSIM
ncbi:hypothetical protein V8B55DRAFT_1594304 [Mucor lusitanicus]